MKFDARNVKQMQPGADEPIDGFPGLRVIVTLKRRSWVYRYNSPTTGTKKQIKLGEWPALTFGQAVAAWEAARTSRAGGVDAASVKRQERRGESESKPAEYTVRMLCSDFQVGYIEKHRKGRGAVDVHRRFAKKLGPIANMLPADVTRSVAFEFLKLYESAPTDTYRLRSDLGAAWDYAMDAGKLPDTVPNWWRLIMRGKLKSKGKVVEGKRTKVRRTLTDLELSLLIPWFSEVGEALRDGLTLYLWTATRGAEIVAIEGRDISNEKDGCWWTVPKAKTKNANREYATDLRVPLIGRAETIIKKRLKTYGKGHLFPAQKHPHIEQQYLQDRLYECQPYSKRKGPEKWAELPVTHWSPHDLRRTSRTMLSSMGCPREVAEAIIGHMPPGIVGVYDLHTYDTERRVWLTKLAGRLESLLPDGGA